MNTPTSPEIRPKSTKNAIIPSILGSEATTSCVSPPWGTRTLFHTSKNRKFAVLAFKTTFYIHIKVLAGYTGGVLGGQIRSKTFEKSIFPNRPQNRFRSLEIDFWVSGGSETPQRRPNTSYSHTRSIAKSTTNRPKNGQNSLKTPQFRQL